MRNALSLFRVLTKNAENSMPKKGTKGTIYMALGIIALSCIMIPCCIIVGFVSYVMTLALTAAGSATGGLLAEIHIMSAFSMVFGILVIFNILFFSSDREHLVPLPFKSHEILAAKFTYAYMAESLMEFMILISMFIGFFIAYAKSGLPVHPVSVLSALLGVFLIPLLPMCYCVIISLLTLALLKNVKSTRIFHNISTILLFLFVILFLFSFRDAGEITVENYVESLAGGDNLFVTILNKIFFAVPVLLYTIEQGSIPGLLLYLLCNAAAIAVMLGIGYFAYQPGLYTVAALGSGKRSTMKQKNLSSAHSIFSAYVKKEWLVLLRTKAYSGNCIFINLLWPVGLTMLLLWNKNKPAFMKFYELYQAGNANIYLILASAVVIISFIASALNSLAATAFTREGAHLSLIKYIPVSYKTQLAAKAFISLIITYPALLLTIIIMGLYLQIPFAWYLYYSLLSLAALLITAVVGLLLDSAHPYSTWDDEYSALRGNLNTFFDMAVVMVIALLLCGIAFLLYSLAGISLTMYHILLALLLGTGAAVACLVSYRIILRNMADLY